MEVPLLTNSQAYTILERHEADSRAAPLGLVRIRYGFSDLTIFHSPGQSDRHQYRWGVNNVERHTALRVVQTFEKPPAR